MDISDIEVRVSLVNNPSSTVLGHATLDIDEQLEISGWKIQKSKFVHKLLGDRVWITPPTIKTGEVWKPINFVKDECLYEDILRKIHDQYCFKLTQSIRPEEEVIQSEIEETTGEIDDTTEEIPF